MFPSEVTVRLESNLETIMRCKHVAIIMDGNGRWAEANGYSRAEGHSHGVKNLDRIIAAAHKLGIQCLTLYCFSTENWLRPQQEVVALMALLKNSLLKAKRVFQERNIRLRTIGNIDPFSSDIKAAIKDLRTATAHCDGIVLILALNYGARDELVRAVRTLKSQGQEITEESITNTLDTRDFPNPDLIIRTAGEQRLSNFLLWQAAYSELIFAKKSWPDFTEEDFKDVMRVFSKRIRRYGKVEYCEKP